MTTWPERQHSKRTWTRPRRQHAKASGRAHKRGTRCWGQGSPGPGPCRPAGPVRRREGTRSAATAFTPPPPQPSHPPTPPTHATKADVRPKCHPRLVTPLNAPKEKRPGVRDVLFPPPQDRWRGPTATRPHGAFSTRSLNATPNARGQVGFSEEVTKKLFLHTKWLP